MKLVARSLCNPPTHYSEARKNVAMWTLHPPPKNSRVATYNCEGAAYSPTKSRFITYEKWIELRSVCANSLEARGLARMDALDF